MKRARIPIITYRQECILLPIQITETDENTHYSHHDIEQQLRRQAQTGRHKLLKHHRVCTSKCVSL